MRFTIRDLLWLTVVVALAVGWGMEYRKSQALQRKTGEWRKAMTDFVDYTVLTVPLQVKVQTPDGDYLERNLPANPPSPNPSAPAQNLPSN